MMEYTHCSGMIPIGEMMSSGGQELNMISPGVEPNNRSKCAVTISSAKIEVSTAHSPRMVPAYLEFSCLL